jgi:5-methylcytosine-specific restriction endonuclease McrA
LNTIDRITKYGELAPNSRKLDDDEILQQPIVRNLDEGKYIPLSDANPMNETIMERVRRSESVTIVRRNSLINTSHSLGKKSFDNVRKSIISLPHNMHDNQSTSSESSNRTAAISRTAGQPFPSTVRPMAFIRRHLTNLVIRNILRKKNNETVDDRPDDDEDEAERTLINDGSNGDLKYKASRYSKEQTQFDRTQLLQTIVNAHDGPIWCMRYRSKMTHDVRERSFDAN